MDSPVITADPPRRTRVSDVLVDIGVAEARVVGVDLSPGESCAGSPVGPLPVETPTVPLSRVHLASHRGHAAQLATPQAMVRNLAADDMAEVLTRASVTHARQILSSADRAVREEAMRLLHPVRPGTSRRWWPSAATSPTTQWMATPPSRTASLVHG